MIIPKPAPEQEALEVPRNDLALAMSLLNTALDKSAEDFNVTPAEYDIIRQRRSNQMVEAANNLHNLITGRRTR